MPSMPLPFRSGIFRFARCDMGSMRPLFYPLDGFNVHSRNSALVIPTLGFKFLIQTFLPGGWRDYPSVPPHLAPCFSNFGFPDDTIRRVCGLAEQHNAISLSFLTRVLCAWAVPWWQSISKSRAISLRQATPPVGRSRSGCPTMEQSVFSTERCK